MTKAVACLFAVALLAPVGAQAADEPGGDPRLKTANRMIRIGDAGWTKRDVERAERENVVSITLPPPSSGKGVVGTWAIRW